MTCYRCSDHVTRLQPVTSAMLQGYTAGKNYSLPAPGIHGGQEIFGQLPLHGYTAGKSYSASSRGTRRARNIPPALGVHGEQEIFHQLKGYTAGKNYSASSRGTCRTRNISPAHSPGEHGRQELYCQLQGHTADKKYITKMKGVTPIQIKFFWGGGSRKIRKMHKCSPKLFVLKKWYILWEFT